MVEGVKDFGFQNDCVDFLMKKTTTDSSKQVITIKAPTGAGKTVILVKYIDTFLDNTAENTAFIWLCPGKGNLEEQSKDQMERITSGRDTRNLLYSLISGFSAGSTTFINWELVTKSGNNALKDGERQNLFDRIAEAHRYGVKFIVIIDEEHANNTKKADDIINAFAAKNIIRVSATANQVSHHEFYEIPEEEVIDEGLISRAISVNEGVEEGKEIVNDYDYLLELADSKRKEVAGYYEMVKSRVRPLVLIQFPAGRPETIEAVEHKLENMGYTYDNGMVNIWMSDDKVVSEDLTSIDGIPAFLLMKQAISTGWDCPRAKILVKLREGGSEDFQIQTIGRIRRMPERKHYGINPLDYCYIYTLDEKYKKGLLSTMDRAYQSERLFIRDEARGFRMTKEIRNPDFDSIIGERDLLRLVSDYFRDTYGLTKDKNDNRTKMEGKGYNFHKEIDSTILQGVFRSGEDMVTKDTHKQTMIHTVVNTHSHGIYLMRAVDDIKQVTGLSAQKIKTIIERLFRKGRKNSWKFLALDTNSFYAFVINNSVKLKMDFKAVAGGGGRQMSFAIPKKTAEFVIPEQELFKFKEIDDPTFFRLFAYKKYSEAFCTEKTRSLPERMFEHYCEKKTDVKWFYKNGDAGQQYFSIAYQNGFDKERLFFPDYIVMKDNGEVWLIETKGGESSGHTKNIDSQVENKFRELKRYSEKYGVKWGFVRDRQEKLYINNSEYAEEMEGNPNWVKIEEVF